MQFIQNTLGCTKPLKNNSNTCYFVFRIFLKKAYLIFSLISSHSVMPQSSVLPEVIPYVAMCAPVQKAQSANISFYGVCNIALQHAFVSNDFIWLLYSLL